MIEPELQKQSPLSVTQLNRRTRQLLETHFPLLWVEGEISNLATPASGHIYFTLKDEQAQVRSAMFRNRNTRLNFKPTNGTQVLVRCRVGLYEGRGEYQLIIEHMEEAGFGALQREFKALKAKLANEGLFDEAHKQALPAYPKNLGVITSATGAALQDVVSVLARRFPALAISVYSTLVQGDEAPKEICNAIHQANHDLVVNKPRCDVLLLTRGGGSLEDLWAFNEETVAYAIYKSKLPIVSAVGHEIDFTIADFVADVRAPTPSAAAELISPDHTELMAQINSYEAHFARLVKHLLHNKDQQLNNLSKRLRHPKERIQDTHQRLDNLDLRLTHAIERKFKVRQTNLDALNSRLQIHHPKNRIKTAQQQNQQLAHRLNTAIKQSLSSKNQQWKNFASLLHSVSPLKTLDRGYAVVSDSKAGIVRSIKQLQPGNRIAARITDGTIHCDIVDITASKQTTLTD